MERVNLEKVYRSKRNAYSRNGKKNRKIRRNKKS